MTEQESIMVFRRNRLGSIIQSVKHVVDSSGAFTATAGNIPLSKTVVARSVPFDPVEIVLGETVNAMFISLYAIGSTGAPLSGPIDWYIAKARSDQDIVSDFPNPGQTGISALRSQILHEEKGLSGSGDGTPMVFKGVIVIPRGMRRTREGDQFFIKIIASGADSNNFCIKAIYKSFS